MTPTTTVINTQLLNLPTICVTNESTVLTDAEVNAIIPALQVQVSRDLASAYGVDGVLKPWPKGESLLLDQWQLVILDDSDQAGALGYHDETPTFMPMGKVFAKSDIDNNMSWTVTASHELLEMLVDPLLVTTVMYQDQNNNTLCVAQEVGDAVEDDAYSYAIDGVKVSDFVLPQWFGTEPMVPATEVPASPVYDFCGHLSQPFQPNAPQAGLLPGGYIGYWTPSAGWSQAEIMQSYRAIPKVGSRRERRVRGSKKWLPSNPKRK